MEDSLDIRWQQWLKKPWDCLYKDETDRSLKYRFKGRSNQVEKHISMLESTLNNESDYFWKDVCRPNLLAYLYLHPMVSKWAEASELIQSSQSREPTSVGTLVNQFQLLKLQKKHEQADAVLDKLFDLDARTDCNLLRLVATAEFAYCLQYFGPDFYLDSIRKYEKVVEEIANLTMQEKEHELIDKKLCFWKFQLAQTYAKLMNRGKTGKTTSEKYEVGVAFRKCSTLLMEVTNSEDHFYHGRALVELIELYSKNEFCGMVGNAVFPYKQTLRKCTDEAYEISRGKDPYVLERCGRYYRQKALTEKEYRDALKVLQEAVDLCPTRHMAWHQMGLVNKHLSALYLKDSKGTARNDYRLQRGGGSTGKSLGKASKLGSKNKTAMHSNYSQAPGDSSDCQWKRAYSDKAREYAEESKECFEEATRLVENTSCRYLVDLAKCYVFCKQLPEAENCYRLAAETEDCVLNDNDAAFLYEQWAAKWDKFKDKDAGTQEDIKSMYRKAIKRSVRGNFTCGKWAFNNLHEILSKESRTSDDEAIQLESSLLRAALQSVSPQENVFAVLLDTLRSDSAKVNSVWRLIELYHRRVRQYDASAACTYLTVLDRAGLLKVDGADISIQRRKIIIDLVTRAAEETDASPIEKLRGTAKLGNSDVSTNDGSSDLGNTYPHPDLKFAFRWLAGGKTFLEKGFHGSNDDTIDSKYNFTDICLVAWDDIRRSDSEDTTIIGRVQRLLEDWHAMADGVSCFPDDIYFDQSFSQAAASMLSKTKAVAVYLKQDFKESDTKSDLGGAIFDVLRKLSELNIRNNICFVVDKGFQFEGLSEFDWPCFQASSDCSNSCMISSFLKALFELL